MKKKKSNDMESEEGLGLSWYIAGSALIILLLLEFTIGGLATMHPLFRLLII